jgi:hypothetical protein
LKPPTRLCLTGHQAFEQPHLWMLIWSWPNHTLWRISGRWMFFGGMIPKTIFRLVMYYQIYLDMWIGRWYPTNILEGNSKTSWLSHSYHMCFSLSNPKMPEHQRTHMFHFWWLKHPVFDADAVFLMKSGWWFQTFFIFHIIWDNPSHWLSYFSEGYRKGEPSFAAGAARKSARVGRQDPTCRA